MTSNRNGGAGATGLIKALAEDFLATLSSPASVEWICNHSRNTQLALLEGYVDVALTYERGQEALASEEGWSQTIGCAFHDHFCLAGPASDPASIRTSENLLDAFTKIASSRALFHSRADSSATMWKERSLWSMVDQQPWSDSGSGSWYKTSVRSPAEALIGGDTAGAYLLTDRSTLLRQTQMKQIHFTTVFFEPVTADDVLMNSCYALTSTCAPQERKTSVDQFLKYLQLERGQDLIANFGKDELGGFPLFAPASQGYSNTFLRGGVPVNGRWSLVE